VAERSGTTQTRVPEGQQKLAGGEAERKPPGSTPGKRIRRGRGGRKCTLLARLPER